MVYFHLCTACCRDCTPSVQHFVNRCTFPRSYYDYPNSCKCNLCLRQPPTLRDLASHSVFHLTFNLSEFQLTARTLYLHYLHAANSQLVPEHKLIPHRASVCKLHTPIPLCLTARTGSTNTAFPIPIFVGVHWTTSTMLVTNRS